MSNFDPRATTLNVDEFIALNRYNVDEEHAHIVLNRENLDEVDDAEFAKLVRACPAALYRVDEDGRKSFDYAGCLECGTCRICCEGTIVSTWENPQPTMGISYRFG